MRKKNSKILSYSELRALPTFEDRFEYLRLHGSVGTDTFGFDRAFNQMFYKSPEWKRVRNEVIVRDNGCDLGVEGRDIKERILIHHMNPIELGDIRDATEFLLNPEYLICVTHNTHNAIHYGDSSKLAKDPVERKPNDTCPWKH